MTDTNKQSLIAHLAEKVCGWHKGTYRRNPAWCSYLPSQVSMAEIMVDNFDPLTDANDCSLVMEAWRAQGGTIDLCLADRISCNAEMAPVRGFISASENIASWPEAVCLAIARAGGWEGK